MNIMKTIAYKHIMRGLAMSLTALLLFSCHQDELGEHLQHAKVDIPSDGRIMFNVGVSDNVEVTRGAVNANQTPIALTGGKQKLWLIPTVEPTAARDNEVTRGTQLTPTDKMSSFGVSAFKHAATGYSIADCRPEFFYDEEASEIKNGNNEGTGVWQLNEVYYWPAADEALTFNAYYPYGNDNVTLVDKNEETKLKGAQRFNVTVASNGKEQVDFMTATTGATPDESFKDNAKPGINLTFNHHMTAIRFVLGDQFLGGYIKSISFSGIYGSGVYTVGSGWTTSEQDKTNDVNINYVSQDDIQQTHMDKPIDGTEGQTVTSAGETFLLIPQTFTSTDAAKITVLFNDGYDDYTVEASLAGQDPWVEGTTVTYAISSHYLTTLRISELIFADTDSHAPKYTWAVGDKVGMYVVAPNGTTIEHENVCCEFVGGTGFWKWQVNHPDGNPVYKLPGYTYYFYYPYVDGAPNGYTILGHQAGEDAETFFSGVISSYSTIADQSTAYKFANADLQVAMAIDDIRASTIQATMLRQVGLARVQLGESQVVTQKVFTNNTLNTSKTNQNAKTSFTATNQFLDNTPCGSGGIYYFWTKANHPTSINSVQNNDDTWQNELTFTLAKNEESTTQVAYSIRGLWDYVNAVWEYEYADNNNYTFTAAPQGTYTYKLEVWGAQGGNANSTYTGGRGGYAYGNISLTASSSLHVVVGGQGRTNSTIGTIASGGYNGGGNCWCASNIARDLTSVGSGGGATHVATASGILSSLSSNTSAVIIVAGGGGGGCIADYEGSNDYFSKGGSGGGTDGGTAYEGTTSAHITDGYNGYNYVPTTGGGQSAPTSVQGGEYIYRDKAVAGTFGQGGMYVMDGSTYSGYCASGGGGGWYGGTGARNWGSGGGSGHINTSRLTDYGMSNGQRSGNGFAKFTLNRL